MQKRLTNVSNLTLHTTKVVGFLLHRLQRAQLKKCCSAYTIFTRWNQQRTNNLLIYAAIIPQLKQWVFSPLEVIVMKKILSITLATIVVISSLFVCATSASAFFKSADVLQTLSYSNRIEVEWNKVWGINTVPKYYRIAYKDLTTNKTHYTGFIKGNTSRYASQSKSRLMHTISGLAPNRTYYVQVASYTKPIAAKKYVINNWSQGKKMSTSLDKVTGVRINGKTNNVTLGLEFTLQYNSIPKAKNMTVAVYNYAKKLTIINSHLTYAHNKHSELVTDIFNGINKGKNCIQFCAYNNNDEMVAMWSSKFDVKW